MKRAGGFFAAAIVATALPIMVASPASADQGDCQYYLHTVGYQIGPKVEAACKAGANAWHPARFMECYSGLVNIGVWGEHAATACSKAF